MKHIRIPLALLCALVHLNTEAQDSTKVDTLRNDFLPITQVSASFIANNSNYPITFLNIDKAQIDKINTGQEPSFILSQTPSMTVYSDAGSGQGYSYFRMRGIDQTRLSLSLDGTPLNEPEDQGVYFSNYPDFFGSISGLQIARGVGTTKNGTASFGGSIDFFSPNLSDSMQTTFGAGYGSFNSYRFFAEHNLGLKKDVGLYIRASHLHSDGYKNRSANTSNSVFYKTGIFKKKHILTLTGFVGNQRNQMAWLGVPENVLKNNPKSNANSAENDNFTQTLNQIQHTYKISSKSLLKSCIYYNYLQGNYDFDLNNFLGFPSNSEMYNYAFESHFMGAYTSYNYYGKKLNLVFGANGNIYQRKHTGSERIIGELYQNRGFKNSYGAFAKADYSITKKFKAFVDVQYRHTDFNYEGSVDFNTLQWDFLNPKLGLSYQVKKSVFYYSIGSSGREPTRTDIFGGNDDLLADSSGTAILFITRPEYVLDQELGWRMNLKKLQGNVNAFHMLFKDEIILNGQFGPNGLALNNSVQQSFRSGLEMTLNYQVLKTIKLVNNTSFNFSQIKDNGTSFQPIITPKFILNQAVVYALSGFEAALSFRYQSKSYIDFANENQLDGYALLNLRASYQVKGLTLSLFMNNLTNKRYYNNGYVEWDGTNKYFVQAPLNVYGMITFSF